MEITPIGINLEGDPGLVDAIAAKARQFDLQVANFALAGDVLKPTMEEYEQEIARLKKQLRRRLGLALRGCGMTLYLGPKSRNVPGSSKKIFRKSWKRAAS